MAAQASPVEVDGLWDTLFSVVMPGARHRPVTAASLRARDAGPLVELAGLQLQVAGGAGARLLHLSNGGAIGRMADAANILLLLQALLLPALRDHPTSAAILVLVDASAVKLREHARAAGGGFRKEAVVLVDRLAAFVEQAHALPPHAPDGGLREAVDDIQGMVKALLDANCTLKYEDAPAGGGGNN